MGTFLISNERAPKSVMQTPVGRSFMLWFERSNGSDDLKANVVYNDDSLVNYCVSLFFKC